MDNIHTLDMDRHIYNHFIANTFYNKIWQIPVKTKIKDLP